MAKAKKPITFSLFFAESLPFGVFILMGLYPHYFASEGNGGTSCFFEYDKFIFCELVARLCFCASP
jgi:hypothetical protein